MMDLMKAICLLVIYMYVGNVQCRNYTTTSPSRGYDGVEHELPEIEVEFEVEETTLKPSDNTTALQIITVATEPTEVETTGSNVWDLIINTADNSGHLSEHKGVGMQYVNNVEAVDGAVEKTTGQPLILKSQKKPGDQKSVKFNKIDQTKSQKKPMKNKPMPYHNITKEKIIRNRENYKGTRKIPTTDISYDKLNTRPSGGLKHYFISGPDWKHLITDTIASRTSLRHDPFYEFNSLNQINEVSFEHGWEAINPSKARILFDIESSRDPKKRKQNRITVWPSKKKFNMKKKINNVQDAIEFRFSDVLSGIGSAKLFNGQGQNQSTGTTFKYDTKYDKSSTNSIFRFATSSKLSRKKPKSDDKTRHQDQLTKKGSNSYRSNRHQNTPKQTKQYRIPSTYVRKNVQHSTWGNSKKRLKSQINNSRKTSSGNHMYKSEWMDKSNGKKQKQKNELRNWRSIVQTENKKEKPNKKREYRKSKPHTLGKRVKSTIKQLAENHLKLNVIKMLFDVDETSDVILFIMMGVASS